MHKIEDETRKPIPKEGKNHKKHKYLSLIKIEEGNLSPKALAYL